MLRVEGNETEDLFYVFHLDGTTSYTVCLLRSVVPNLGPDREGNVSLDVENKQFFSKRPHQKEKISKGHRVYVKLEYEK